MSNQRKILTGRFQHSPPLVMHVYTYRTQFVSTEGRIDFRLEKMENTPKTLKEASLYLRQSIKGICLLLSHFGHIWP
jgi:hypothetical protein